MAKTRTIHDKPDLTLVKLGGSLITHKDHPNSVNQAALKEIARAIKLSGLPTKNHSLMLVHGGGSFGHYYARRAGLSTKPKSVSAIGIALTNQSMMRLHCIVTDSLMKCGVPTETILPPELITRDREELSLAGVAHIRDSLANKLIPISFGYVSLHDRKAHVISGDSICLAVANYLKVKRIIFAMDVDGIYPKPNLKGQIIRNISAKSRFVAKSRHYDVTGGILSKVQLGLKLQRGGVEVFYVNGSKPGRLENLLVGREALATKIG